MSEEWADLGEEWKHPPPSIADLIDDLLRVALGVDHIAPEDREAIMRTLTDCRLRVE